MGGGAQRSVVLLAEGLIHRGHQVDFIMRNAVIHYPVPERVRLFVTRHTTDRLTSKSAPHALSRCIRLRPTFKPVRWGRIAHGILRWPAAATTLKYLAQVNTLASYMEREKPDCVLPSLFPATALTLWACRVSHPRPPSIPIIHSPLGEDTVRRRALRAYQRFLPDATHCVGVSRGVSASVVANTALSGLQVSTIYNPAIVPDLRLMAADPRDHPWLMEGQDPVILAAGRLSPEKDYPTLINAFARLATKRACRLIILGEGRQRGDLERLVNDTQLTDRVSMPGWTANPFAYMSRAALFVLSSLREGLGLVLIEALACGCPCVSTDCPSGPREILQGGDVGQLVPVGDINALATAMEHTLDHRPDPQVLEARGMEFSVDRAATAYENLLSSVLSAKRTSTPAPRSPE